MLIRVVLVFCGLLLTLGQGFQLEYQHVRPSKVKEGGKSVIFSCKVDDWVQFCTFKHNNNKCVFGYSQNPDRFESVHCDAEFQGRARLHGNTYNENKCSMKLSNVNLKDAGLWTCEVEEWEDYNVDFRNKGRKKGIIRHGRMNLQVTPDFKMVKINKDQKVVEG